MIVALATMLRNAETDLQNQIHSKAIITCIEQLPKQFDQASNAVASYSISQNEPFKESYERMSSEVRDTLKELKKLVAGNATRRLVYLKLETTAEIGLKLMDGVDSLSSESIEQSHEHARQMYSALHDVAVELRKTSDELLSNEQKIQAESPGTQRRNQSNLFLTLWLGTILNITIAVLFMIAISRGAGKRLDTLADNAVRLAARQPLNSLSSGTDEITRVDRIFHEMADALEASVRRERAMIENAIDVICSMDSEGRFTEVNPACLRVWGFSVEELVGQRYINIVAPDDRDVTMEKLHRAIETNDTNLSYQNRLIRKDGAVVDMLWSASWSSDRAELFCVAHDITEAKQLERMKQQFVNMVSHDLRTPLTSSLMVLEGFSSGLYGEISEQGKKRVTTMSDSIVRLITMINQLLDLEKLEAGKMGLSFASVGVDKIVDTAIDSVRGVASRNNVELGAEVDEVSINADADRIVQVLVNLLGNAIKFSPTGSQVKVVAREHQEYVEFKVIDQGPGIEDKDFEKIFDRFSQLDESDGKKQKTGTGLGLAICKLIVEEHNGEISVDSRKGEGSTFTFRIPRKK